MSQYSVSPVALNAPGLPFSPVVYQDPEFVALLTSFGLAGQAASTLGEQHARDRNFRDQQNAKSDEIDRAVWSRAAGEDLATIRLGIDNGTVKLPAGAEPGKFADELVQAHLERLGPVSEAGRDAYMRSAPHVAEALARQSAIDTAKDRNNFADALSNQAYLGDDPAGAVKSAIGAGFDETAAYAKVVMPALKTAAQLGDAAKFDRLAASLPAGQFDQDVLIARRHMNAVVAEQAGRQQDAIRAGFQALENDNAPTAQMRQELEQIKPRLTPANYDQINRQIESIEKARSLESKAIGLDAAYGVVRRGGSLEDGDKIIQAMGLGEKETAEAQDRLRGAFTERTRMEQAQAESSAKQAVYIEALMGAQSGVPLSTVQDRTIVVGGKTIHVTQTDQIENTTAIALSQIAKSKQPDQARAAMVEWSASQGVYPKQFNSLIETAPSLAAQVLDGKPVPPALMESIALWETAKQRGGPWADKLGDDKSRAFLDAAVINLRDAALTPAQAIGMAAKATNATKEDHEAVSRRLTPTILDKTRKSLPSEIQGALNSDSAMADITQRARAMMLGTNASASALGTAANDYKASAILLGRFVSPTNQVGMTPGLREKLPDISTELSKAYAKRTGTNAADKSLVWNSVRGTWQINDWMGHALVGPGAEFTTEQLGMIASAKDEEAAGTELADIVKAVNKRQANRPPMVPYGLNNAIEGEWPFRKPPKPGIVTGSSE